MKLIRVKKWKQKQNNIYDDQNGKEFIEEYAVDAFKSDNILLSYVKRPFEPVYKWICCNA